MRTLRVLLVDDEEIVRRGLAEKLDWAALNLELIGTAAHGREALELLARERVDIVVTDILMPELDGIGLIQAAVQLETPPSFIVLSGYNEFEFARRAMQLGVRHYVLKPTQLDELRRALREVSERIHSEERLESQLAAAEHGASTADPLVRQGVLRSLLAPQRPSEAQLDAVREMVGGDPAATECSLVVVDLGIASPMKREPDVEVVVDRSFRADEVIGTVATDAFIVLVIRASARAELRTELESFAERLKPIAGPVFRLVSAPPAPLTELSGAYEAALSQLQSAFYSDETIQESGSSAVRIVHEVPPELERALEAVRDATRNAAMDDAATGLDRAIAVACDSRLDPALFKSQCVELLVSLGAGATPEVWEQVKPYVRTLQEVPTSSSLRRAVYEALERMIGEYLSLTESPQQRMVRTLQSTVKNRFSENDLSLTKLTETVVHGNVDYVGRVFRKLTGQRFTEFLIQVRMDEAQRLLQRFPQMPIREIARRVGYGNNAQYFSYSFHRYVGVSPSEYRGSSSE